MKEVLSWINWLLSYPLIKTDQVHISIGTLIGVVVALLAVTLLMKLVYRLAMRRLREQDRNNFLSVFRFSRYLLYILVVLTVLHTSGVNLTVLLTASAALFVGLGFALQYIFQDLISGIAMIMDKSLNIGDVIEVNGKVGRVFEIRLRTTRALTRDDKVIIIPNHLFLTDSIYNYTQNHRTTRECVQIGVAYGSDVALVTRLLEEAARGQAQVLKSPSPFVLFDDFGDSALVFTLNFFVDDSFASLRIKSGIRYRIDQLFREHGVVIPFPQRDIHLYAQGPSGGQEHEETH